MNGIGKKLLYVGIFIAAFIAVKYGIDAYREHNTITKVEGSLDQLKSAGTKNYPDLPVSQATQQEASERATQKLNSEVDKTKRLQTAASTFLGFFLVNTRERPEYCREQSVDITPFVSAFEQGHSKEAATARTILSGAGIDENKLYAMLKPQLRQVIDQDMKDFAASNKASVKQACEAIAANGQTLALEMHISKLQPVVYKALTTGE